MNRGPAFSLAHCLLLIVTMETAIAIYLPWKEVTNNDNSRQKSKYETSYDENQINRQHETSDFDDDEDILHYLKVVDRQVMIWRCRNAMKPYWDRVTVIPSIDLYCSVIGVVARVDWHHRHREIGAKTDTSHKYELAKWKHDERGRHFTVWTDFRLRIYNVSKADSGAYRFAVFSPDGDTDEQIIYVDVSSRWNHLKQHPKKIKNKRKKLWLTTTN